MNKGQHAKGVFLLVVCVKATAFGVGAQCPQANPLYLQSLLRLAVFQGIILRFQPLWQMLRKRNVSDTTARLEL